MKNLIKSLGLVLALIATSANAIPTLYFDGDIGFDVDSGLLSVTSILTATSEIDPAPALMGSSLEFSVSLESVDISNMLFTVGVFGTTAGTDLTVIDGDMNTLLTGNFSTLEMMGGNGWDSGLVTGSLDSTGGLLAEEFGIGNLIALEFNLSTSFSAEMFESNFLGAIDGRIEGEIAPEPVVAVPEPTIPALLALGLLMIGFVRKDKIAQRLKA